MALEILQILASGSFGHVAVVRDGDTGRLLAAKVLKENYASNAKQMSRLRDEATLLARLDHPNVVAVEELREVGGRPVLLMEWVRGAPLGQVLARRPAGLDPADVCEVIRLAAEALDASYHMPDPATGAPMRVIHRDIKPSNLILSASGELKLVDFGVAKGDFAGKESETVSVVLGAYGYVAPERLDGAEDSPAGDVFALGCLFFELLTGRRIELSLHPAHHAERMRRHLMHLRPEGVNPRVVQRLSELIARMAAYSPEDRPTHAEVADAAARLLEETRWRPDLKGLAESEVVALLQERSPQPACAHPAFDDLAFLEQDAPSASAEGPPRQSDQQLRAFLATPGWEHRSEQLRRMLAIDPSWTEAPFLEVVQGICKQQRAGLLGWLRGPQDDRRACQQLALLLELLKARPGPEVRRHAWRLLGHPDREVSQLARQVYVG